MKTIGLIGAGKWGQNYIKLADKLNIKLQIADRLTWKSLIKSRVCDGVVIATHPDSHIEIAIESLEKNIPVMIEKPLALNYKDAVVLQKYKTTILVNNLHLFSPAFEYIVNNIDKNNIVEITSIGCNKGPYRDYSPLFDYGSHDLSMGIFLLKDKPILQSINTLYLDEKSQQYELNIVYKNIKHNMIVGNFGPNKQRLFKVKTKKNDIFIYNDLAENKLLLNNQAIDIKEISTLENSFSHFIKATEGYIDDRFGIEDSLLAIKFLEEVRI